MLDSTFQIFEGDFQEDRCSKILESVMERLPDEFLNQLGGDVGDIGTHSSRKGPLHMYYHLLMDRT